MSTIIAAIKCDWYLLTRGMWRGERRYTYHNRKLLYIAAVTGSIWHGTIKVKRVFLDRTKVPGGFIP